ncbi:MAG: hypothetical protein QXX10_00630 [Desulfurococcaceae archaeon]
MYYYKPREAVENQRKITIESTTTLKSFISSSAELLLREFPWILEKSIIRTDSYYAGGFKKNPRYCLRLMSLRILLEAFPKPLLKTIRYF